jgi:hypothetical protein
MQRLKKLLIVLLFGIFFMISSSQKAEAQIPIIDIIKEAITKVIKAIDLKIQRLQTKTIWLQNAQKVLENKLSKFKLDEIAQWTEKQRQLYQKYYDELWQVKNTLATYHRIALILQRQKQLVAQYKFTWQMVNQDKHFSQSEIDYMYLVYTGIINQSVYNLDELMLVINSNKTQMTDAKRLEVINKVGDNVDRNYSDLQQFNNQNVQLSINRAKDENEVAVIKKLYGLN